MAYIHCHNCNWSQDDFWDFSFGKYGYTKIFGIGWGYNPISYFIHYFKEHIKPRVIKFDNSFAKEQGWKTNCLHSWFLIRWEFKRMIKSFKKQYWWTYSSYKKSKIKNCPDCDNKYLCID